MEAPIRKPRDVAIPSTSFRALRRTLHEEAGPLVAIHALQSAGYEAGTTLFDAFRRDADGGNPAALDRSGFFDHLGRFLGARGWGTLRHDAPHPAIGLLSSPDWAETGDGTGEAQPVCAFSSGMLSALLTHTAGAPVAVLQVACRAQGDERCSFAFGSEGAVHALYGLLLEDRDLRGALAEL